MTAPTGRVRMTPESRREQLLELGARLLATRTLEEISIELLAEEAGISRGLLYHYLGNKQEFHVAVVRRAVDDLFAITAPRELEDPLEQLSVSLGAYVDYVTENHTGYVSLIRAAAGGNEELRAIYQKARRSLTDRIFDIAGQEALDALGVADTHGLSREELLGRLALALPAIVAR